MGWLSPKWQESVRRQYSTVGYAAVCLVVPRTQRLKAREGGKEIADVLKHFFNRSARAHETAIGYRTVSFKTDDANFQAIFFALSNAPG
jgi:hypothetical protein